jgi:hypothetical protein
VRFVEEISEGFGLGGSKYRPEAEAQQAYPSHLLGSGKVKLDFGQ